MISNCGYLLADADSDMVEEVPPPAGGQETHVQDPTVTSYYEPQSTGAQQPQAPLRWDIIIIIVNVPGDLN
jgi:hypothetical protein